MATHPVSPVSHSWIDDEKQLDIRAISRLTKEDNAIVSVHRMLKGIGIMSTVLLSAVALTPDTFGIPAKLQPWVFLTAIFWVLVFCAGIFDF